MERAEPMLRVATPDDASRVEALMKESAAVLFPRYYDERQSASAVRYVAQIDPMLLTDGTYFVLESDGQLVACGGWSRRDRLYTGSGESEDDSRTLDPATEPAKVRAMFVRADWTRRGLGRRIVEECEAAARREGYRSFGRRQQHPGGRAGTLPAISGWRTPTVRGVARIIWVDSENIYIPRPVQARRKQRLPIARP